MAQNQFIGRAIDELSSTLFRVQSRRWRILSLAKCPRGRRLHPSATLLHYAALSPPGGSTGRPTFGVFQSTSNSSSRCVIARFNPSVLFNLIVAHKMRLLLSLVTAFFSLFALIRRNRAQNGICPLGFVWGGQCGFGVVCPPSLPPFRCLRGSCCRDQRPLFARLGPIVYPQDLLGGFGGISPGTFGGGLNSLIDLTCFDSALNCYLFQPYCFVPIYQLCMFTNCRRTCGYCGLGTFSAFGGFGGLGAGNLGGFGGGLLGGTGGLNGFGELGAFGASPVAPGIG
uniref:ShKT domain-containing protein n=1 Tax=Globodera rostochiensis TaxID=31243 RepID=A0A914HC20_GLORO